MDVGHGPSTTAFRDASAAHAQLHDVHDAALWPTSPVPLTRGRQPRDALAKTVTYNVSSLDDFETALRAYLDDPPEQPEHTEAQLSFWIGASFMVAASSLLTSNTPATSQLQSQSQLQSAQPQHPHQAQHRAAHAPPPAQPAQPPPQPPPPPPGYQPASAYHSLPGPGPLALGLPQFPDASNASKKALHKASLSIMDALAPANDPKDKMRKQRAIAKCCVDSIQKIDGYRYSFHNCWNSREDDSFRFSYYCNDSLLNKDRAANGKSAKLGKRATKPVYDCKGVLSIKFSATKNTLDVFYKHVPIHKTYEERAPPPRKDSKRRKFLEENDPEALQRIASRPRLPKSESNDTDTALKSRKKIKSETPKLATNNPSSNTSLESDLRAQSLRSLLELIQVDPPAAAPEASPAPTLSAPAQPLAVVPDTSAPQVRLQVQPQLQPQPKAQVTPRRRSRNSCDVCKIKKTKCDGARPVCQTCIDKKRQCCYSDMLSGDGPPPTVDSIEPVQPPAPVANELSELEKMKKELQEAKARIQQLESEKRASVTPSQTPQMAPRPQSQPQPQPQQQPQSHAPVQASSQSHHVTSTQHSQVQSNTVHQPQHRPQTTANHRTQLQQLNTGAQRAMRSPQQMTQSLEQQSMQKRRQSPQQPLQATQQSISLKQQPQKQPQSQQIHQQQQQQQQQQLQAATVAHRRQSSQNMQIQAPQTYFTSNHSNHAPYGSHNRPITQSSIPTQNQMPTQAQMVPQNAMATQNTQLLAQTQAQPQATHQMQSANTGLTPTATSVDSNNPYGANNPYGTWPPPAYYAYQNTQQQQQQQQQQEQWAAARGSGVFR